MTGTPKAGRVQDEGTATARRAGMAKARPILVADYLRSELSDFDYIMSESRPCPTVQNTKPSTFVMGRRDPRCANT